MPRTAVERRVAHAVDRVLVDLVLVDRVRLDRVWLGLEPVDQVPVDQAPQHVGLGPAQVPEGERVAAARCLAHPTPLAR